MARAARSSTARSARAACTANRVRVTRRGDIASGCHAPPTSKGPGWCRGPSTSYGGSIASALSVRRRCRRGGELVGLVVEVPRDLAELGLVGPAMVATEQQLAAGRHGHADVRLGAAAVAAVRRGKRRVRGKSSGHVALSSVLRLVPG